MSIHREQSRTWNKKTTYHVHVKPKFVTNNKKTDSAAFLCETYIYEHRVQYNMLCTTSHATRAQWHAFKVSVTLANNC